MTEPRYSFIDADTHITEARDVWTSRVPSKWKDRVPRVERDPDTNSDIWYIGDRRMAPVGITAVAGWPEPIPKYPPRYEDAHPGAYDAKARLQYMDENGVWAQVLYPNIGGFGSQLFLGLDDAELKLACVRAYNDFLIDWIEPDPRRFVPIMATPFWDLDAAVAEIQRCAKTGHKGVLLGSQPETFGEPTLASTHWDPLWAAAQDVDLSISFHIGSGDNSDLLSGGEGLGTRTHMARVCARLFMENSNCIADLIFSGICHRFPKLKFVSVESGASWVIFALEAFDWQWKNNGVAKEHPEYDLLPSEYFRRQIYASFWFEEAGLPDLLERYPDNILYETDYPHPTCQAPGPVSAGTNPRLYADRVLGGVSDATLQKVMHDTAAELYGIA